MTTDEAREFVDRWRKAGPLLEEVRRQELRHYRHEDRINELHSLMQIGSLNVEVRPSSGLVEQQRIFQKARK
jgi:hypothetical protein